jgi:hypothetical protein
LIDKNESDCLAMKPRHYGVDIIINDTIKMIASHDDDRLTFVTVEDHPEIFYSVDDAIEKITGGLRTMQHLAYTAYFCLSLFEALHEYEKNLNLPPSQ